MDRKHQVALGLAIVAIVAPFSAVHRTQESATTVVEKRFAAVNRHDLDAVVVLTGLGLMFFPSATLRLLQSNATDGPDMARFAGILMLAIGLVVSQIIRHRLDVLYPATVAIRLVIWVYVAWLYQHSGNPFFAAVLVVLRLGILLTGSAYFSEARAIERRRDDKHAAAPPRLLRGHHRSRQRRELIQPTRQRPVGHAIYECIWRRVHNTCVYPGFCAFLADREEVEFL